ncbi:MAG TPA: alanine dehydrogenase [Anaerolineales bacterium]
MNIGIPKERRPYEFRVGLSPAGVQMLCRQGHICYIEHGAGLGAGFTDQDYELAGGRIAYTPHEVFGRADLLLKVSRPIFEEIEWLRPGTAIAGLLHLSSARQDKIDALLNNRITAVAYEHIQLENGSLPVMRPLSQIGGRMVGQIAARLLQNDSGGKGILMGGMPGVPPAEVVIIGAGIAGRNAARSFLGLGAHVTMMDTDLNALQRVYECDHTVSTVFSNSSNLARACAYADVIVGAVLVVGEKAPVVITREMVRSMKPRALVMDISIDEGGCVETSRPTTHDHPTFVDEGVIHYCVPNIPSVVARTSTYAFVNAASPYILEMANKGVDAAIRDNPAIARATNTYNGELRNISRISPAHKAS